jgi:hypothetical protein
MAELAVKTLEPGATVLPPDLVGYPGCGFPGGLPGLHPSDIPSWSAWWENNIKETVDNYGIDRQVPFWHYSDKVANNQAGLELANANNQAGLELAKTNGQALLELAGSYGQSDMRRFQSDIDLRRAADDNAKSLLQTAAISGYLRHVDDNHVMTTNILAALTEGLAWVRALEVNITAAKSLDATIVNKVADIAQKALDVQSGGVIGNALGGTSIAQPFVVKMQ